ncbi:GvpL/GvpF family gas vesicle protein [Streptomyces sp. NBC_00190]|uniref:GvpL/GvpF family gas vesicle protein n=1 Tax=unclassified Streptomyces TaxID=2593676 RepID=UPI002E2E03E8|nr:GvpL/GvpF family gas vesicle protein [Streptomyces sp. NBC_00190]WSZ38131.1 GvpL/GvpF family gas vesicle protein [Streptomyces sp. NBC_00868]
MTTGNLTYVYAVTHHPGPLNQALAGLHGIGQAPLRLLPPTGDTTDSAPGTSLAQLAFVASDVPEQDFNETALKSHFEDLDWLEYVARTHHEVVQAVAARATVLPLRMATVYQDDHRARQALSTQQAVFTQRLDQLRAHTEYGVKVYLTPAAGQPPSAAPAPPASPGKAYLQARRAQRHSRDAVYRQAEQAAEIIEAIASRHTTQRVRHAPQRGELTGPQENVLNDAYLIPDDQAEQFQAAIADAARSFPDLRIEVTGPWAPYSFATPAPAPADTPEPPR